jgi:hypothetical protein
MKCQQPAGFLIPRPCRNEATGECAFCRKAICSEHMVPVPDGGMACTGCAADRNVGPAAQQQGIRRQYDYDPFYSYYPTGRLGYVASDYDAFEGTAGDAVMDTPLEGS